LVLEGLCKFWGLYFTALKDTMQHGSTDMQTIIDQTLKYDEAFCEQLPHVDESNFRSVLNRNREIARKHFLLLLVARLAVFRLFVDCIPIEERNNPEYRKRWLTLQIKPSMFGDGGDIFQQLTAKMVQYVHHIGVVPLSTYVRQQIKHIKSNLKIETLHIAVDEIQHVSDQYFDAFRSDQEVNGALVHRPLFREMLVPWIELDHVLLFVSGTGVSGDVIEDTMNSAVAKYKKYTSLCETGVFGGDDLDDVGLEPAEDVGTADDTEHIRDDSLSTVPYTRRVYNARTVYVHDDHSSLHREYIERFLPPNFTMAPHIQKLIGRISYWLRGRYECALYLLHTCLTLIYTYVGFVSLRDTSPSFLQQSFSILTNC
jgi:hypothetical protein